ncbi:MAG: flavodoxin domain-containing protein [Verrucomicrobiota bacterium]
MNTASLNIYFATETGNAETLAHQTHERAVANGRTDATVESIARLTPEALRDHTLVVFVVSTWGDGEPPSDATDFYYGLEKATGLDLSGLTYAVFGLGDRDYADFNAFARNLDEQLAARGARRLVDRAEADLDFDDTYAAWADRLFDALAASPVTTS